MLDSIKPFRSRLGAYEEYHHSSEFHQTVTTGNGPLGKNGLKDEDTWTVHPTSRITRTYSVGGEQYEERDSNHLYEELRRQQALASPSPAPRQEEYHQTNLNVLLTPPTRQRSEVSLFLEDVTPKRFAPVKMTVALPQPQLESTSLSELHNSVRVNRKVNIKRTWKVMQTHEVLKEDATPTGCQTHGASNPPLSLHQFKIALPEKESNVAAVPDGAMDGDAFQPVEITVALPPSETTAAAAGEEQQRHVSNTSSAITSSRDATWANVTSVGGEQATGPGSRTTKMTTTTTTRHVTTTKAEKKVHRQELDPEGGSQGLTSSSYHYATLHNGIRDDSVLL